MTYEIGEVEQIITPDGQVYSLNDGLTRAITEIGGRGMVGVEYLTEQGYMQAYSVVTGWRLEPRSVTLILTFANLDRPGYWEYREQLLDHFRFNRGGPFTLRHIRADGTRRDLYCYTVASPVFQSDMNWSTVEEEINLVSYDPLFKDPDYKITSGSFTVTTDPDLVFPAEFPIQFQPTLYYVMTLAINYGGTFPAYPILQVTGPYSQIVFTHKQTGYKVGLSVPIGAGEKRTIDLSPGNRSIVDAYGNSKWNELLLPDSNLTQFNIRPAGQSWEGSPFEGVPGGVNEIVATATDPQTGTSVSVTYQPQYVGM